MPFAPRLCASSAKLQTTLSSWTPLNHTLSNSKVFAERRSLLAKWFDRWSDSQRKAVLQDLVLSCSSEQLVFLSLNVNRRLPLQAADFTCMLPRALCLYVFSFLDPRSLCRCARVSWHWRSIVELDQLWMPKCLRLGWCVSFSPTAFEQGVWKRHYIQTVQELRLASLQVRRSQTESDETRFRTWQLHEKCSDETSRKESTTHLQTSSTQQLFAVPHEDPSELDLLGEEHPASGTLPRRNISKKRQQSAPPPWRDSDRHPKDTLRFNYLDNLDPSEQVQKGQMNVGASTCCGNEVKPDDGCRKSLSEAHYKLRKAKSLMFLSSNSRPQHPTPPPPPQHDTQCRPSWATCSHDYPVTKETASSVLHLARWNAGIRPGPVRPAVPRLSVEALRASQRSHRSAPSKPLFDVQPWTVFSSHR